MAVKHHHSRYKTSIDSANSV